MHNYNETNKKRDNIETSQILDAYKNDKNIDGEIAEHNEKANILVNVMFTIIASIYENDRDKKNVHEQIAVLMYKKNTRQWIVKFSDSIGDENDIEFAELILHHVLVQLTTFYIYRTDEGHGSDLIVD